MKEDGEKERKSVFRPEPASGLISKVYLAGSCLRHNGRQEEGGICIYMVGTLGNEGSSLLRRCIQGPDGSPTSSRRCFPVERHPT